MAALIRARPRHRLRRRAEKVFATRITLFQLSEKEIIKHYRLSSFANYSYWKKSKTLNLQLSVHTPFQ